ncbi:MAG: ABC transporter permease subunit [Clostridiaceae bacterium]
MISLIHNEIKKLFTRWKSRILLISFAALVALIAFGVYQNDKMEKEWSKPETQIENLEESIKYSEEDLKNSTEEDKKWIQENIDQMKQDIEVLKNQTTEDYDAKKDLEARIENVDFQLKDMEDNNDVYPAGSYKSNLNQEKQLYQYMLDNNIDPRESTELNAFSYSKSMFMILGSLFLVAGVIVFAADMVSGEFTPPTMKFLLTQPVSRAKVLLSKYISLLITSVLSILSIEIISFVIMGFIFGFGSSNYPLITGQKYQFDMTKVVDGQHPLVEVAGSSHIISQGQYTLRLFLFQILFIIACVSFAFMISTILKSSMISMGIGIVSVIVFNIIVAIPYANKIAPFLFTTYGSGEAIFSGQNAAYMQIPYMTTSFGVIMLIVWSAVCYLIAHFVFVKKDILI